MTMSSLPLCAAFQSKASGKHYLRYVPGSGGEDGGNDVDGDKLIHPSGEDAISPFTRFYVEPSAKHHGLVHIRCCYNNRYWRLHDDGRRIAGAADEPEEDLSKEQCTLFQLRPVADNPTEVSFLNVKLGKYCRTAPSDSSQKEPLQACLHASEEEQEIFTMLSLGQMRVLPRHSCFRGDNNAFLRATLLNRDPHLEFASTDIADPTARHTVTTNGDGTVRIKSDGHGQFWRNSKTDRWSWVLADSTDTSNDDVDTLFRPTEVPGVPFGCALVSLGNDLYCKRLILTTIVNCLAANEPYMSRFARLLVEEPVRSRAIDDVRLSLAHARIYGEVRLAMASASVTNSGSSASRERLVFEFGVSELQGWSSSVTLKCPVPTTITSPVPSMEDGGLHSARNFSGLHAWGTATTVQSQRTVERFVDVPAMTKMTVICLATTSRYDVPFCYVQTDTLLDGQVVACLFQDGVYSGQNFHSFTYDAKEEKIN